MSGSVRNRLDIIQTGILLMFSCGMYAKVNVAQIARELDIAKSTISRVMIRMSEDGMINRDDIYKPKLTEEGKKRADELKMYFESLIYFYEKIGCEREDVWKSAFRLTVDLNDVTLAKFREQYKLEYFRKKIGKTVLRDGKELAKYMLDGEYELPFIFFKTKLAPADKAVSMADDAFAHPCYLTIQGDEGWLVLIVKETEQVSALTGLKMRGRPACIEYKKNDKYYPVRYLGNAVSIPITALTVRNRRADTEQGCYTASVTMRMDCTVGPIHMPTSEATLLVWL